jgi:hypothetical protein
MYNMVDGRMSLAHRIRFVYPELELTLDKYSLKWKRVVL